MSLRYVVLAFGAALLSLAAGVLLGAGPLQQTVDQVGGTSQEQVDRLQREVAAVRAQAAYGAAYATTTEPLVVAGQLRGQRVVVVVGPGTASGLQPQLVSALRRSGAVVTGTVTLLPAWTDPGQAGVLDGIVSRLAPPTADLTGASAYDRAAGALAAAVVTSDQALLGGPNDAGVALLSGLSDAKLVTVQGTPDRRAALALVLLPARPADDAARALEPLAAAFDGAGSGAVAASTLGSGDAGGSLAGLRADATVRAAVSSVDNADQAGGRVGVVLALRQQLAGASGHYGVGVDVDAAIPPASAPPRAPAVASPRSSASASPSG